MRQMRLNKERKKEVQRNKTGTKKLNSVKIIIVR